MIPAYKCTFYYIFKHLHKSTKYVYSIGRIVAIIAHDQNWPAKGFWGLFYHGHEWNMSCHPDDFKLRLFYDL